MSEARDRFIATREYLYGAMGWPKGVNPVEGEEVWEVTDWVMSLGLSEMWLANAWVESSVGWEKDQLAGEACALVCQYLDEKLTRHFRSLKGGASMAVIARFLELSGERANEHYQGEMRSLESALGNAVVAKLVPPGRQDLVPVLRANYVELMLLVESTRQDSVFGEFARTMVRDFTGSVEDLLMSHRSTMVNPRGKPD